jgi:putative polyhydroxyalkanoate system protein
MPDMTATIPHQLTRAEAKRRIQNQVDVVRRHYGHVLTNIKESWTGDKMAFALSALGHSITGDVTVEDQAVHVRVALPVLLQMLATMLKPEIEGEGRYLLSGPK